MQGLREQVAQLKAALAAKKEDAEQLRAQLGASAGPGSGQERDLQEQLRHQKDAKAKAQEQAPRIATEWDGRCRVYGSKWRS